MANISAALFADRVVPLPSPAPAVTISDGALDHPESLTNVPRLREKTDATEL